MSEPIIVFDYEFSPYAQKIKLLLEACSVPYKRVDVSPVIPRKQLVDLGITYRRIPVLAVGKDVYCDSSLIVDLILNNVGKGKIEASPADKGWEAWGFQTFVSILFLIPSSFLTDDFVKDRETVFPVLKRPDYSSTRPSGVAELQARMSFIENEVLTKGPYVNGSQLSVADIHIVVPIRWALMDLDAKQEKQLGREQFPKVWKLIESLPEHKPEVIEGEEAKKVILAAGQVKKGQGIMSNDPLGLSEGTEVTVESMDTTPGAHPQKGKLIASDIHAVILELDNGIHLHFPREGYLIRKA